MLLHIIYGAVLSLLMFGLGARAQSRRSVAILDTIVEKQKLLQELHEANRQAETQLYTSHVATLIRIIADQSSDLSPHDQITFDAVVAFYGGTGNTTCH